ncbi:MAG TPA: DUF4926 domain-containing protein [Gemmataceae bacterium]
MSSRELDVVVLTRDPPLHGLKEGDVGTVVHAYAGGEAFAVEFVTGSGRALAAETLRPADVRPRGADDILHVRSGAA